MVAHDTSSPVVNQEQMKCKSVGQWIISLAISVVCCAIIFVVSALYIAKIQESANISEIRIELLHGRFKQLSMDVEKLTNQQSVLLSQGDTMYQPAELNKLAPINTAVDVSKIEEKKKTLGVLNPKESQTSTIR